MALPPTKTQAAGFVAKAMANTHPSRRRALLVEMMAHAAEGLRIIQGCEGAAETAYRLGDDLAARATVRDVA